MSLTKTTSPGRETRDVRDHVECAAGFYSGAAETAQGKNSVEVATTIDAVETLRPVWRAWANSLDADIDFFLHQMSRDPQGVQPYVIAVYNDGAARGMLVGQVRKRKASATVSFVNIPGPAMRVLEVKKGGRMGQPSSLVDKLLALELFKAIKRGDADSICFERLPLQSGLFHEINQLRNFLVRARVPNVFCYSSLSLTAQERKLDRLFPGKTIREIRRKTRIVERTFPGQVSLKCFSEPGEIDAGIRDAMKVAVTTWQHYLGPGLTDTGQMRETYRFFAEQGWLRIFVLYIKRIPCSFLTGQLYNGTFYCQFAGYHPYYTRFSVGSLLTARAFEDLASAGVQRVDLGEGGQEHNRRLGCQKSEEATVHVYSPTLRGAWLNLFFGTTQVVRAAGRRARSALMLNRLGRFWRRYLVSKRESCQSYPNLIKVSNLDGSMSSAMRNGVQSPVTKSAGSTDPYLVPAFPLSNRLRRMVWGFVYAVFFRTSPRPFHWWRAFLLRCFGARLGPDTHICPKAMIWAPWNLVCADRVAIADEAIVYNPERIELGSHAIVSQQAYLCGATHDYEEPGFPLVAFPILIGPYAWVCARATVQPGVSMGEGAVLALGSVAARDLQPWTVYGGVPARKIKMRREANR